ncbi:NAD(P)/FAD-dependent oxidoreductase [Psychromarinibacter halotolerans]|uniref:NAD(P)/FAD-dependent oxidoreductase n=1 Tax=Psychromarinibacter halotolerans TaxID=1775175 RepID=A0ABV7GVW0_9RHOB|nr:FAD-binding oxidoreductase [Psychromarinibacter halotolerans]MDF0597037.1 FAD-binding oxidoreductase [Psychromarinibacter halotolerans]
MNLLHANDRPGTYPGSWYAASAEPLPPFPALDGDTRADIVIVGGGFTGLSTALHAARLGYDVAVIEAHRVGFGASGRNGGQVLVGQRKDQVWLEQTFGKDDARKLWDIGWESVELVKSLIADHGIYAEWRTGVADAAWSAEDAAHAAEYAAKLRDDYGLASAQALDRDGIRALIGSEAFHGGMIERASGHLHPLRYAFGLAKAAVEAGVRIYERTEAQSVKTGIVRTASGTIRADQVVLACNGYLGGLERKVAARIMPINNFIVATEPLGDRAREVLAEDIAVADTKFVVNYWRLSHDGRLLFGGGENYGYRFPKDLAAVARKPMLEIYPQLADVKIDHAWGGTLAITRSRMPDFARPRPGIWSASGYSGHGVAMATLAGKILAQAMHGDMSRFDVMAKARPPALPPLGPARGTLVALAMSWFALRDRLGM